MDKMDIPEHICLPYPYEKTVILSMMNSADQCAVSARAALRQSARNTLLSRAQSVLGLPQLSVGMDHMGAPVWPDHQRGSFSHWEGITACLLCDNAVCDWGVDLEGDADPATVDAICGEAMTASEHRLISATRAVAAPLIFFAKESFFKAAFPQVGHVFGFDALHLSAPPLTGHLEFTLCKDLSHTLCTGQKITVFYRRFAGAVLTWTALQRAPSSRRQADLAHFE